MVSATNVKTVEGQFLRELEDDFGLTPVVAHALLKRSQEIVGGASYQTDQPKVGQIKVLAVASDEPAGKPLAQCKLQCINLTLDAGKEDADNLRENGAVALRQTVLCRITEEAIEQGAYLTEDDVARILRCDVRTIKRDVRHFRNHGIYIPLRGNMVNTGRGQTHKVAIVRWYIKGMTYTDLQMRTRHSIPAISRYIETFGKIVVLIRKNLSKAAIGQIVSISEPLVDQYVKLYDEVNTPEYTDQLDRIANRVRLPDELAALKKRLVIR